MNECTTETATMMIEAVMSHLPPHKQAEVINNLVTKYGLPRTLIVEMLGWLGAEAEEVESLLGKEVGRNHLIPKESM